VCIHIRRGGVDSGQCHSKWLSTITGFPDVISMSFVPITSLLTGVRGSGFLNHALNLYLRCMYICVVSVLYCSKSEVHQMCVVLDVRNCLIVVFLLVERNQTNRP
jgi:hypothetical protein